MDAADRRRAVVFLVPIIVMLVPLSRIVQNVRTVDFLQILGGGVFIGIALTNWFQIIKPRSGSNS